MQATINLKSKESMQNYYILTATLVVVAGVVGYLIGTKHSGGSTVASNQAGIDQNGSGLPTGSFGGRRGMGGGFSVGQVLSVSGNTIIIQDNSGATKTVNITGSTTISKTVTGSSADLSSGQNVTISGTADSSGSVNATTIQIRPAGSSVIPGGPTGSL